MASGTVKFAYDALNRLTSMVDSLVTTHYTYDAAGQLLTEDGPFTSDTVTSTYSNRRRIALSLQQPTGSWTNGFGWDLAGRLTNVTSAAGAFAYNELTAAPSRTYSSYDANGNPTAATVSGAPVSLTYDDENRLLSLTVSGFGSSTYTYDGLGRLRTRTDSGGQTRYVYDGMRVIQERDSSNNPTVSYTRGNDLAGSLEGAGGIGGLLARSSGYSGGAWTNHACYHADGNGNITCLINTNQSVVASYRYDPFGNTLSSSGSLATANLYRFSSKQFDTFTGMYYYGYRFYDPVVQRWLNRDPIDERGGVNLYGILSNDPENKVDVLGLGPVGLPGWGNPGKGNQQSTAQACCAKRGGHYGSLAENKYGGDMSACIAACVSSYKTGHLGGGVWWPIGGAIGTGIAIVTPIGGAVIGGTIGAYGVDVVCARACSEPGCSLDQPSSFH